MKKNGLKTAFLTQNLVVSGCKNYILVWSLDELLKGEGKARKKIVPKGIVGVGQMGEKCTVGFENGWGWFE